MAHHLRKDVVILGLLWPEHNGQYYGSLGVLDFIVVMPFYTAKHFENKSVCIDFIVVLRD